MIAAEQLDRLYAAVARLGKPYFDDGGGRIVYHGDCRELLPLIEPRSVDLVLTDPPYVGLKGGYRHTFDGVSKGIRETVSIGDQWNADLTWASDATRAVRFGVVSFCTHHSVAETRGAFAELRAVMLLTWYKRNAPPTGKNVPRFTTEFAWAFAKAPGLSWDAFETTLLDIPNLASGCMATERIVDAGGKPLHPTQKPLKLIRDLIAKTGADLVLDPFAGSGTTGRACKDLGRCCVQIELEERYCEIAANRLRQEVLF